MWIISENDWVEWSGFRVVWPFRMLIWLWVPVQNYQTYLNDSVVCEFHRNTVILQRSTLAHSLMLCVSEFLDMINHTFLGKKIHPRKGQFWNWEEWLYSREFRCYSRPGLRLCLVLHNKSVPQCSQSKQLVSGLHGLHAYSRARLPMQQGGGRTVERELKASFTKCLQINGSSYSYLTSRAVWWPRLWPGQRAKLGTPLTHLIPLAELRWSAGWQCIQTNYTESTTNCTLDQRGKHH